MVEPQHEFRPPASHRHVMVAGRNPDLTALQSLPLLAFLHLEPGERIETLGEQASK